MSGIYIPRGAIMRAFRQRGGSGWSRHAEAAIACCRTQNDVRSLLKHLGLPYTRRLNKDARHRVDPKHNHARKCEPNIKDIGRHTLSISFGMPPVTPAVESFRDRRPS